MMNTLDSIIPDHQGWFTRCCQLYSTLYSIPIHVFQYWTNEYCWLYLMDSNIRHVNIGDYICCEIIYPCYFSLLCILYTHCRLCDLLYSFVETLHTIYMPTRFSYLHRTFVHTDIFLHTSLADPHEAAGTRERTKSKAKSPSQLLDILPCWYGEGMRSYYTLICLGGNRYVCRHSYLFWYYVDN